MKLSLNWIKDYVDIPADLKLSKLVYDLTMSTVEVEGTENLADRFNKMVVGVIKEILPHPNADKLRICKTDIGNGDIRQIVCGGSNLTEGAKVAVTLPGSLVRWHGEGELVELSVAKVRGVESYGMISASTEIGLGDLFPLKNEDEILDLSFLDVKAGTPIAEALEIDDIILEIDNKSLTNRPDLWGHYGIAREISAIYDLNFKEIEQPKISAKSDFKVEVEDFNACPRYIGVKLENLNVKESPIEIQKRLWSVGARPINAIVDITNYVMLATGQPTHAFDSDHIKGNIVVRKAKKNEKLLLLNSDELTLNEDDLVIADKEVTVGLAGVMGGEKDSVLPETKEVILEIANFEATGIRKTATRHENRTESAIRYEKGIDPERCDVTLTLAMELFKKLYPDIKITGYQDLYPKKLKKQVIEVSRKWLDSRLGKKIDDKKISVILEKLGFEVKINGEKIVVTAPTWRSTGDISMPDDILEEIARMYGFDNFETMPITTTFTGAINQIDVDLTRKINEYLAFRCGMQEIFTYPWIHVDYLNALSLKDGMLSLTTPPSPEEKHLRSSLLPNLCKAIADNLRYFDSFSIFESAQVFFNRDFTAPYDKKEKLPLQRKNVAGALVGQVKNVEPLFRKIKGIIEQMPRYVHMETITFEQREKPIWADSVIWINVIHSDKNIGSIALLSKKASLDCGIKNSAVMLFEMDIDELKVYPSRTNEFNVLPEYPMTEYDISVIVDMKTKWEKINSTILSKETEFLQNVSYVGKYEGEQVPSGKKSITIRMTIGSLEKTLTSEEIEKSANEVIKRLNKEIGAELRH